MSVLDKGTGLRYSRAQKKINYNLVNGILDQSDVEDTLNPLGLQGTNVTTTLQDYSKMKAKIDLLVGESVKRPFEFAVRAVNPTSVSEREETLRQEVIKQLVPLVDPTQTPDISDEEIERRLKKLEKMVKYEWKDTREKMGQHLLNFLVKKLNTDILFMRGMEDVCIVSEESYAYDIRNGDVYMEKLSPLNVQPLRMGNSTKMEDADILIIDGYYPLGYIIDEFAEELKESQVNDLEDKYTRKQNNEGLVTVPNSWFAHEDTTAEDGFKGLQFLTQGADESIHGEAFDNDGNIRVVRVMWKSLRKIGKLSYYGEDGTSLTKWVDEEYKPNELLGETVEWIWITEWWHGYRLGADIYIKLEPLPRIGSSLDNPIKCIGPIVGTIYNIDQEKQKSLADLLKPYEYLHAEIMNRVRKAINRFRMPSADVDIAAIPDFMDISDYIYYDQEVGYRFRDSFKEGDKGIAQGKLAGSYQNMEKLFNPDMRNYIDQHIQMLNYVDHEMGIISGITHQREGQISEREAIGNVEIARTQSSHITEKLFALHDNTKIRALTTLLEFAKYAYRDKKNAKINYVTDDLSTTSLEISGPLIAEAEFGIFVSNSRQDYELRENLKSISKSLIQNNAGNLKDLISVLHSPSIVEMRKQLEQSEEERQRFEEQKMQSAQKTAQMQLEAQAKDSQAERDLKDGINIRDNKTKLAIAFSNTEPEVTEVETGSDEEKLKLQKQKQDDDKRLKDRQLKETERHNKATESISKMKPKVTKSK